MQEYILYLSQWGTILEFEKWRSICASMGDVVGMFVWVAS